MYDICSHIPYYLCADIRMLDDSKGSVERVDVYVEKNSVGVSGGSDASAVARFTGNVTVACFP
jgi:hypothetical protein